jgi:hypothetical protein
MKNKIVVLSLVLLASMLALPAFGQTLLTQTTLAAAVSNSSTTTIKVASATGITANSTVLYIADGNSGEAVVVNSVNGTYIGVTRGYQTLGSAAPHASGALVFVGPSNAFTTVQPSGSCVRANVPYLPVIALGLGGAATTISDCLGGVWVTGVGNPLQEFQVQAPGTGGTAYTSLNGTGTATVAGTFYCNEIDLDANTWITGLGVLNGTTVGTDNHLVALYDASGNLLANSAAAGVLAASASTYQQIAFTSKYFAVGPARFFGCVQSNGTTATVRMIVTGTQDTYLTKSFTGVFGTIPATFTVPTTFTTAVGPYLYVY